MSGLLPNDNVKVSGVTVGKVTGIRVDDGGAALVDFEVDDDVEIPEDSTIVVRWRDTFGLRFLYVEPGESDVLASGGGRSTSPTTRAAPPPRSGPSCSASRPSWTRSTPACRTRCSRPWRARSSDASRRSASIVSDAADLTTTLASRDAAIGRTLDNASTILDEYAQRDEDIRALVDSLVSITDTLARRNNTLDTAVTALADLQDEFGTLVEANEDELRAALDALESTTTLLASNSGELDEILARAPAVIVYHRVSRLGTVVQRPRGGRLQRLPDPVDRTRRRAPAATQRRVVERCQPVPGAVEPGGGSLMLIERPQWVIGLVAAVVILAGTGFAVVTTGSSVLVGGSRVRAEFTDASGLK